MKAFSQIIQNAKEQHLQWEFYEGGHDAVERSLHTIPGKIIGHIYSSEQDERIAEQTVGLLSAFVARRSLVCWFLYCDSDLPLRITNCVVDCWLDRFDSKKLNEGWFNPVAPSKSGEPIVDCRWQDTMASSLAVAHATRYVRSLSSFDAIMALSQSFNAFDVSPIGSVKSFEDWIDVAGNAAMEKREMPLDEQFALADFEVPEAMIRSR